MRGVVRAAGQRRLRSGVSLIDEQSAGPNRLEEFGKNLSLQIEKCHDHIELCFVEACFVEPCFKLGLRSLEVGEIIYYKVDVGRERAGILTRLFDSSFGNINERNFPALLRQPDRVASGSSGQVEGVSRVWKQRQNVFGKRAGQEGIGNEP